MKRIFLFLAILISLSSHAQFFSYDMPESEQLVSAGVMAQGYGDYERAIYYYERATKIDPKLADAYYYWGTALTALANMNEDEKMYNESFEKFRQAIKMDDKKSEYYNDWAYSLMELGKLKDNLKPYRKEVESLLKKTEQLGEQMGAYNLACLYSLSDQKKKTIEWLEKMMTKEYESKMDNLSRRMFDEDPDFDNIRQDTEFRQFLNRYFPGELPDSFHAM